MIFMLLFRGEFIPAHLAMSVWPGSGSADDKPCDPDLQQQTGSPKG
jgi:hypothetical protein